VSSCILYKHYRIQINEANIYKLKVYRAKLIYFISFQLYEVLILCDNIYWFYHGLALYADILPFAIAQGKIFGIKGQPVVKSVYIQAPMNYFLNIQCHGLISVGYTFNEENYCKLVVTNSTYINKTKTCIPLTTTTYSDGNPSPALGQVQL
jgi:hypothetical protein